MDLAGGRLAARPPQQFADPRNCDAEPGECGGAPELGRKERRIRMDQARKFSGHVQMENQTHGGGEQARPHPSENAGDQDRRQKKQVERLAAQRGGQQRPQDDGDRDERQRRDVDRRIRSQHGADQGLVFCAAVDRLQSHASP